MNKSDVLRLVGAFFIFLSIMCSLLSNHYNAVVMGEAALGYGVWGATKGSMEWAAKKQLREKSDGYFRAGVLFALLGIGTEVLGTFMCSNKKSQFGDFDDERWKVKSIR